MRDLFVGGAINLKLSKTLATSIRGRQSPYFLAQIFSSHTYLEIFFDKIK